MQQQWLFALRVLGIGWYVAVAILLGVLGGLWLDGRLNTRPVFLIIGLFVGLMTAGYGAYVMIKPFFNNNQGKGDSSG
jgi:F0F1-type ATP synthase assembly protein I